MPADNRTKEGRRSYPEMPADLRTRIGEIAKRRGHITSTLAWSWGARAVELAAAGRHAQLPAAEAGWLDPGEPTLDMRFRQEGDEAVRWADQLQRAGTSLRAVLITTGYAYVEADGVIEEMVYPTRRRPLPRSAARRVPPAASADSAAA